MPTRFFTMFLFALSLAACQGPEPTARNPNGTLALLGSGNYVYNRATGSYSRYSSDPKCNFNWGGTAPGCSFSTDAAAGGGPGGK